MTDDVAIKVGNVSKTFILPHEKHTSLKSVFVNFYKRRKGYEKQQVLNDISFEVKKGEFFGIVGRNGSGKSTLLKLLAGIYAPDKGNIIINGKLTPFIELGVGFNPELSGRENVFLNGALLGFNRKEMEAMYGEIVEFAELERFMDQKLKNYSSGMQVRLAFSIAIRAQSDILILDEVLAVGDAIFQKKCYNYFKQLKKDKRTVVFVSHDTNALLEYCDRAILIEDGLLISGGKTGKVVNDYIDNLNKKEQQANNKDEKVRWGTGGARIKKIEVKNEKEENKSVFSDGDKELIVSVEFHATERIKSPVYGITIMDAAGQRVFTSNTLWSRVKTNDLSPKSQVMVLWKIPNAFNSGDFIISPAIADKSGSVIYDWLEGGASFKIRKNITSLAYINIEHRLTVKEL